MFSLIYPFRYHYTLQGIVSRAHPRSETKLGNSARNKLPTKRRQKEPLSLSTRSTMGRYCSDCGDWCSPADFSGNQWRKGDGASRCYDCVNGNYGNDSSDNGRYCSECNNWLSSSDFSNNQWAKGDGFSRCYDCVNRTYCCNDCGRTFQSRNNLEMHVQVHRPRNIACPVCGDRRFASGANAVQHVESGACPKCNKASARQQIYQFASAQVQMKRYMPHLLLTNVGYNDSGVPDFPYHCPDCNIGFRNASQLLQHQDHKHNSNRMLTFYG